ncbi:MAG TPA: carboxypeptidase-like regulatory domain-containing protein [Blastocatellia bacterium]|nr:carboxypeptidase-like regulatory domain-containing protein [Blastocatellia bacterium]
MRLAYSFFIACLLVWLSQNVIAQQDAKPKREGVITGRIAADGRPVAGAKVFVHSTGGKIGDMQTTASDADGVFEMTGLGPGAYSVSTMVPGYVEPSGSLNPRMYRIGENVTINLMKGGVITGRVTDEFGEPMVGARVVAQKVRTLEGKPDRGANMMEVASSGRETDDRGVYRIFGLVSGVYVVSLNGPSISIPGVAQSRGAQQVYHPSSNRNTAAEVTVMGGAETSGIDIRRREMRGHSISGSVTGDADAGGFMNAFMVMLIRAADKEPVTMTALVGDKNFSLGQIDDGDYDLGAWRFNERLEFSTSVPRRVTIKGADVSGIELKLLKLGSIEGRILIEPRKEGEACKDPGDFSIEDILLKIRRDDKTQSSISTLAQLDQSVGMGRVSPVDDGAFVLKNVEPGRIRIETDLPGDDWYVREITQKSSAAPKPIDAAQNGVILKSGERVSGVVVTIDEGAASLKGKVVPANENAKLAKQIRVHLIPAEMTAANETLRYYEKMTSNDGSFDFRNLAPGKYLLHLRAAEEGESPENLDRPAAWDPIERAKLRREAEALKIEVELKPCQRVKDHVLRLR